MGDSPARTGVRRSCPAGPQKSPSGGGAGGGSGGHDDHHMHWKEDHLW